MPDYYYNPESCPYRPQTVAQTNESHWEDPCSGCGGAHLVYR